MPLEDFYTDDQSFTEYSMCFQDEWAAFGNQVELLEMLGGNEELARPIAFHIGSSFRGWFTSSVPALDDLTPQQCLQTQEGIKRLKVCLQRIK